MGKVFLVVEEWNVDCEPGLHVDTFKNKSEAMVRYNEMITAAKSEGFEFWKDDASEVDGNEHYEIYEDGYYSQNHITVRILESELK